MSNLSTNAADAVETARQRDIAEAVRLRDASVDRLVIGVLAVVVFAVFGDFPSTVIVAVAAAVIVTRTVRAARRAQNIANWHAQFQY